MDTKLKELRTQYEKFKKRVEKPYQFDPENWQSERVQWSDYQKDLDDYFEAREAFFEYLKEKRQAKKLLEKAKKSMNISDDLCESATAKAISGEDMAIAMEKVSNQIFSKWTIQ